MKSKAKLVQKILYINNNKVKYYTKNNNVEWYNF